MRQVGSLSSTCCSIARCTFGFTEFEIRGPRLSDLIHVLVVPHWAQCARTASHAIEQHQASAFCRLSRYRPRTLLWAGRFKFPRLPRSDATAGDCSGIDADRCSTRADAPSLCLHPLGVRSRGASQTRCCSVLCRAVRSPANACRRSTSRSEELNHGSALQRFRISVLAVAT